MIDDVPETEVGENSAVAVATSSACQFFLSSENVTPQARFQFATN